MSFLKNLKKKEIISDVSYNEFFSYLTLHHFEDPAFNTMIRSKLIGRFSLREVKLTSMESVHRKCWFINSGMIIAAIPIGKRESMQVIFRAGTIAILPYSFFSHQMPDCYFIACPDTHLLEINSEDLKEILTKFPDARELFHLISSSSTSNFMEKSVLLQFSAKQRIIEFHRRYPDTEGADRKVNLRDNLQANYLDINPSTYSRLQKEIYSEMSIIKL